MKTFILLFILFISSALKAQPVWTAIYDSAGTARIERGNDIIVDLNGNIIITGATESSGTDLDPVTIKYNSAGVFQWSKKMFAIGLNSESGHELAADTEGNIYVCGDAFAPGHKDAVILKYSPSGTELVNTTFDRQLGWDEFSDIVLDDSANIYVTGYSNSPISNHDIVIAKYSSTGALKWVRYYSSPGGFLDSGNDIAIDEQGNLYVCGYAKLSPTNNGFDAVILKYDNAGNQIWVRSIAGPVNKPDNLNSIALDDSGNIYGGGSITDDSLQGPDCLVVKYDPSGNQLWVRKLQGTSSSIDQVLNITLDNSGNLYATGYYGETGLGAQILTAKYDASGTLLWMDTYSPTNGLNGDRGNEIVVNNSGNIYVCGEFTPNGEFSPDAIILKYNNSGALQWTQTHRKPISNGLDYFSSIAIDLSGSPVVTGTEQDTLINRNIVTIKYNQTVSITSISSEIPEKFSLFQNYPNPFNPMTKIKFDIPKAFNAKLAVYDILGKEVAVLVNDNLKPGSYEVELNSADLPSGTYFYRLITEGFSETKKMTLIK